MKKIVSLTQTCTVEIDKKKFNATFMKEFRASFYRFYTIEDHTKHLGQLYMRGLAHNASFIEGYGFAKDMGVKFYRATNFTIEVVK